jgi:hypothetical protein
MVGFETILATFQKNWAIFSNLLVTLNLSQLVQGDQ